MTRLSIMWNGSPGVSGHPSSGTSRSCACARQRDRGRFKLDTSKGAFSTDNLSIAVGTYQHPNIPA
jgi:putative flavoprotein involved in K+ transport